jgi:hypothetical protein
MPEDPEGAVLSGDEALEDGLGVGDGRPLPAPLWVVRAMDRGGHLIAPLLREDGGGVDRPLDPEHPGVAPPLDRVGIGPPEDDLSLGGHRPALARREGDGVGGPPPPAISTSSRGTVNPREGGGIV